MDHIKFLSYSVGISSIIVAISIGYYFLIDLPRVNKDAIENTSISIMNGYEYAKMKGLDNARHCTEWLDSNPAIGCLSYIVNKK